jgi:hypothetical protein
LEQLHFSPEGRLRKFINLNQSPAAGGEAALLCSLIQMYADVFMPAPAFSGRARFESFAALNISVSFTQARIVVFWPPQKCHRATSIWLQLWHDTPHCLQVRERRLPIWQAFGY